MVGAEFDALVADLKANGLRNPLVLLDGMVLDGGNRYRACVAADVAIETRAFDPSRDGNPVSFVLSANLHRRHMTAGQQAAIVASAQDWAKAHVPHREKGATLHPSSEADTVASRAARSGASHRTQQMADKVAREAPELARKVAHGEVSLPKAVQQVQGKTKPAREPEPDDDGPSAEEVAEARKAAEDDAATMAMLLAADDKLAASVAEVRKLKAQVRILESRIQGLTNEAAQAVRLAKHWRSKFERLQKQAEAGRA